MHVADSGGSSGERDSEPVLGAQSTARPVDTAALDGTLGASSDVPDGGLVYLSAGSLTKAGASFSGGAISTMGSWPTGPTTAYGCCAAQTCNCGGSCGDGIV